MQAEKKKGKKKEYLQMNIWNKIPSHTQIIILKKQQHFLIKKKMKWSNPFMPSLRWKNVGYITIIVFKAVSLLCSFLCKKTNLISFTPFFQSKTEENHRDLFGLGWYKIKIVFVISLNSAKEISVFVINIHLKIF